MAFAYRFTGSLALSELTRISAGDVTASIDADCMRAVRECWQGANEAAARGGVYGRTTGVGANKGVKVSRDPVEQGMGLLRSHSVAAGAPVPERVVRAMVAVRINQLCHAGSGIAPEVLEALVHLLNEGVMPSVLECGSVGTADLSALARTGLALCDQGFIEGGIGIDSALPLMSSSALTIARSLLAVARLREILDAELAAYALSLAVMSGNMSPVSDIAADCICVDGAKQVAARIRRLVGGASWKPDRVQDSYALRALLPLRAVTAKSLDRLEGLAGALACSAQENPLFVSEGGAWKPVHHAAFHQAGLAHELDGVAAALAREAPLMLQRIAHLNDERFSNLPRFLAPRADGSSGTMIVEYVAADALGEVQLLGAPVEPLTASLSCALEEDASFAPLAAGKLERAASALETAVACELLVVRRAWTMRCEREGADPLKETPLGSMLQACADVPTDLADRDLSGDIKRLAALIPHIAEIVDREG